MADKCVAMMQDAEAPLMYYLWDSGWLVGHNLVTGQWDKCRIKHPSEIAEAVEPNRELAPEVHADD